MKLFWTVGVDDAGEIVRDYETLLRKEFGEDTSAFLSFDDFLRVYDYHEQSILGPGGGGGGWWYRCQCEAGQQFEVAPGAEANASGGRSDGRHHGRGGRMSMSARAVPCRRWPRRQIWRGSSG